MGSKTVVVLLGAGRPLRGSEIPALVSAGSKGRVLDWLLDALRVVGADQTVFIGGYRLGEVVEQYPDVSLVANPRWEVDGPVGSLLAAPLNAGDTVFVSYTDVVYDREVVRQLAGAGGDVVVGIDETWRTRFGARPLVDLTRAEKVILDGTRLRSAGPEVTTRDASGEFMGICKLGPSAVRRLIEMNDATKATLSRQRMSVLFQHLASDGLDVQAVTAAGRWAELNAPQDLARFVLGTKATTLNRLKSHVEHAVIPDSVVFTVRDWARDREPVVESITTAFSDGDLIIRSSTVSEDSWASSNAGAFLSVGAVPATDDRAIVEAVDKVIASYPADSENEEVLVQPLLVDIEAAGVVMTRAAKSGAPYWVINYDDTSGRTDSVTAGDSGELKTAIIHRSRASAHMQGPMIDSVLAAVREIEEIVGHDALDIEFAVLSGGQVAVLQVRPIVADHRDWQTSAEDVTAALLDAADHFDRLHPAGPFVVGDRPCFGIMPDWNPAEILGVKPRPLALSLYQYLITDEVWAQQRAEFGYRDVRPCPLVVSFAGQPFVDVRASFNSFVPASLDDGVARRIVNHYLERLRRRPDLHDKIEFEVALTCMPLDFEERVQALLEGVLTTAETADLRRALARLTSAALSNQERHLGTVEQIAQRADRIRESVRNPLDRAYLLLEDCRRLGTLPFSHLARHAFIAVEWLRSLGRLGVVDTALADRFFRSLDTVTRQFTDDLGRVTAGALAWEDFLGRYGHLRPGTYDIQSPCYADSLGHYLRGCSTGAEASDPPQPVDWPIAVRAEVERLLANAGISVDFDDFERFCRSAIQGREYAKFVFTRNVSLALEAIADVGASFGLEREQLAYLSVSDVLSMRRAGAKDIDRILGHVESGRREHQLTLAIELPALLFDHEDFWTFEHSESVPSFVSTGRARASAVVVDGTAIDPDELDGSIVLIDSADPGYDWLFARGIRGLVTAFGGANSHMAIRAAERSLPAAIGVGQRRYDELKTARVIELDCAARIVKAAV